MSKPSLPTANKSSLKVGLISLGCAKNLVDAEIMLGALIEDGIDITNQPEEADVMIVNTCSFIDSAQEESVDAILESDQVRAANNRGQGLVVSGCLSQRFRKELPKLLPEVDAFMGIDQVRDVAQIVREARSRRAAKEQAALPNGRARRDQVAGKLADLQARRAPAETPPSAEPSGPLVRVENRPRYIPDYATPRFRLTPRHFAYVKIAEGCNHPCSFCIIPRMRGSHRSRSQEDVVSEARQLIQDGVKELNLISQDSTYYGLDLRPNHRRSIASPSRFQEAAEELPANAANICSLLRALNDLKGKFWIRLLYTHPAHWTDELIQTIAECPKVARYIDIPLQHIHDNMLERMRRETSRQYIVDLLKRIRRGVPGIAIRTTFIVGFPGETPAYFESLLDFIRETRFERLGVFTYSHEEGTRAGKMEKQVGAATKRKRRDRAMAEQLAISRELSAGMAGKTLTVLAESEATAKELSRANVHSWEHGLIRETDGGAPSLKGRYIVARSEADAPDIDGRVYVKGDIPIGRFSRVRITGHTDYDLIAKPV